MSMFLPQPTEGGSFTPPPAGTHPAICYRFIDLGTQKSEYEGQAKQQRKVLISWEITDPELLTEEGEPFTISSRYTWSMHEKSTLRKTLESWRGTPFISTDFGEGGFDVKRLLGAPCLLSILHTEKAGKTYANITGVMKMPKGMPVSSQRNKAVFLTLEPAGFDRDVFLTLGDKLQEQIKASPEYQALVKPQQQEYHAPHFDPTDPGFGADDIPF
jgi:hypothetical protein